MQYAEKLGNGSAIVAVKTLAPKTGRLVRIPKEYRNYAKF